MGNHTAGLAMGRMAETLITMRTNQTALELLDEICAQWRGCDAQFGAVNPEHPHQIHPQIYNYTDPSGPLGALISEAFGDPARTTPKAGRTRTMRRPRMLGGMVHTEPLRSAMTSIDRRLILRNPLRRRPMRQRRDCGHRITSGGFAPDRGEDTKRNFTHPKRQRLVPDSRHYKLIKVSSTCPV